MAEANCRPLSCNDHAAEGSLSNVKTKAGEDEAQTAEGFRGLEEGVIIDYDSLVKSLVELSNKTGMPIIHENGQRRYGPPMDFAGNRPPLSCEVYVGHLPKDCFEPELVPVFSEVGRIFQMRLMMDFNKTTRGYCFVQYFDDLEAERAVQDLNNFEIRKGWHLTVVPSTSKRTLYLRNLPRKKSAREVTNLMSKLSKGVVAVTVPRPLADQRGNKNRGYCFVEFDSHMSAVSFLSKWCRHQIKVYTDEVTIQWADLVPQENSIIVYDLAPSTSDETILATFNEVSGNGVDRIEKGADGVYVFFKTRLQAQTAKNVLHYKYLDGARIHIKINTVTERNRMSINEGDSQLPSEKENMGSQSNCNNENYNINPVLQSNNNVVPVQNIPNFNNTATFDPNFPSQGPRRITENAFPSPPTVVTPQMATQGIYLYGPYYPPPVYMLPVHFVNGSQQPCYTPFSFPN